MAIRSVGIGLFVFWTPFAAALEAVVEVTFSHGPTPSPQYAKLIIDDNEPSELFLQSCARGGADLGTDETPIDFPQPVLRGPVAKTIYRLYRETDLTWAIPRLDLAPQERVADVGYFDPPGNAPSLRFVFDRNGKQLQRVVPLGFYTVNGLSTDVTVSPTLNGPLPFEPVVSPIPTQAHNLLQHGILPAERPTPPAVPTSRRFVAHLTALGPNPDSDRLTFSIPFREVAEPHDGYAYVSLETDLQDALVALAASGNEILPTFETTGGALKIPALLSRPTVSVKIFALPQNHLEFVDAAAHRRAVEEYAVFGKLVTPGVFTVIYTPKVWNFGTGFSSPLSDALATLPLKVYVAGHFLAGRARRDATFGFTTLLRLGMIHGDRREECASEIGKAATYE